MKKWSYFNSAFILCSISIFLMSYDRNEFSVDNYIPLRQQVTAIKTNKVFQFAGEDMPTTQDCKERLDKELLKNAYWHSSTLLYLKRANRYFPTIEKILAEEGVPQDFKFLAVAESGLENAVSPAKAVGFWQIRKLTAKELNLEDYDEVDERYHLEKSTRAAAKYLKKLKSRFGTWTNAAAAYNIGPTSFAKILRAQGEESYYNLNVNKETSQYVFRLIAIKEVLSHPEDFGFFIDPVDLYQPRTNTYNVLVDTSVNNWSDFAHDHGLSYRELKIYNPWLRDNKLTVKKNKYMVEIPR